MIRILGVDPGSAATGWALLTAQGNRYALEVAGVVRPAGTDRAVRLAHLDEKFSKVARDLNPDQAAVESSFSGRNPRSSLSLAESRGVVLAALGRIGVEVHAYAPAAVKSAIVGHGQAEKQQIVFMVMRLLGLDRKPAQDAADAIAVALTHLHTTSWKSGR